MNVLNYEILSDIFGIDENLIKSISNRIIFNFCIEDVVDGIYCDGPSYEFYGEICHIFYIHKDSIVNCLRNSIKNGINFNNDKIVEDFENSSKNHSYKTFLSVIKKDDLEKFLRVSFIEVEEFIFNCKEVHKSLEEEALTLSKKDYDEIFVNELKELFK